MEFRICHKSTCFVEKKNGVETERKRLLSYASCLKIVDSERMKQSFLRVIRVETGNERLNASGVRSTFFFEFLINSFRPTTTNAIFRS